MHYPVDPQFPTRDEDESLKASLAEQPVKPIFIMGLHRSGTTFLYDSVARAFPLAQLTLYDFFYYDRLLRNHQQGGAKRDAQRLNACFAALGIRDRNIDSVPVSADEVEEYGYLLRRRFGSFKLNEQSAVFFEEMCRKLLTVHPGSEAVLLKNPWDTGSAKWIAQRFSEARFIYISREPIAVLNSMLNALLSYLDGPQHYLEMLLDRGDGRRSYRAGYIVWVGLRGLRRLIGRRAIARLARPILARTVAKQVAEYRCELAAMPSRQSVELDYSALRADPEAVMASLESLLGVSRSAAMDNMRAVTAGRPVNPVLRNYAERLDQLVEQELAAAIASGPTS